MRPVLSFFKPVAVVVFIMLSAASSLFAQDVNADHEALFEAGKVKLMSVHRHLVDAVDTEEDLYTLRNTINQAKAIVAPHFPPRVDDPKVTAEQALRSDDENIRHWIVTYPGEVSSYVGFVYEVINTYRSKLESTKK